MRHAAKLRLAATPSQPSRRRFLKLGALAVATWFSPRPALAHRRRSPAPERSLTFYNTYTGESLQTIYWVEGDYIPQSLDEVSYLLRDHLTNEVKLIDPKLLDLLHGLKQQLGTYQPFHVISGYRSPSTNAMLRRSYRGVAKHSLHIEGKAVDIRMPGYRSATIRRMAINLQAGGVGYYPRADFTHVDTGPVRYW